MVIKAVRVISCRMLRSSSDCCIWGRPTAHVCGREGCSSRISTVRSWAGESRKNSSPKGCIGWPLAVGRPGSAKKRARGSSAAGWKRNCHTPGLICCQPVSAQPCARVWVCGGCPLFRTTARLFSQMPAKASAAAKSRGAIRANIVCFFICSSFGSAVRLFVLYHVLPGRERAGKKRAEPG